MPQGTTEVAAHSVTGQYIHDSHGRSEIINENSTIQHNSTGSSLVELFSQGSSKVAYGNSRTFTVPSDVALVGDIFAEIDVTMPRYSIAFTPAANGNFSGTPTGSMVPAPFSILEFIDTIEVSLGSNKIETLTGDSLQAHNATHNDADEYDLNANAATGHATASKKVSVRLPSFTSGTSTKKQQLSNANQNDFPHFLTPNAPLKFKVTFKSAFESSPQVNAINRSGLMSENDILSGDDYDITSDIPFMIQMDTNFTVAAGQTGVTTPTAAITQDATGSVNSLKLYAMAGSVCPALGKSIKSAPFALARPSTVVSNFTQVTASKTQKIQLDSHTLYTSYLYISGYVGPNNNITQVELKCNGQSLPAKMPASLLTGPSAAKGLGINNNRLIKSTIAQATTVATIKPKNGFTPAILPISGVAYDHSSVVLANYDKVVLEVTFEKVCSVSAKSQISVTSFGSLLINHDGEQLTVFM